ncbi:MAG: DNA mismatch repair protein MutS, partial [Hyphomicrobiales bacterium]|nr:DNA mismatch repair protein MutS [Hyphomicrobiales bacterium]
HFHELTALAKKLDRLHLLTLRVTEYRGDVVFLHEVISGVADRSYGIQVAKLAGLPPAVINRAQVILTELETQDQRAPIDRMVDDLPLFSVPVRSYISQTQAPNQTLPDPLRQALQAIDPDSLTPREALDQLYQLISLGKAAD